MVHILLYISLSSNRAYFIMWVLGVTLFLLLCYGIYYQWKRGKNLKRELVALDKLRQDNIEYAFILKAMKIAVWRYSPQTKFFVFENDYRDTKDIFVPGTNESYVGSAANLHPADSHRVTDAFSEICHGRTDYYHEEYRITSSASGNTYWEESYATIVERDADGNPTLIVGTSKRIDERKEMEASLVNARNKAEESDRLKTAFLANMGHEIRTPLNAIVGFADLLPVVQTEEDRNQLIEEIRTNNRKLLGIIDGLVSMSKIEAGAKSLLIGKVDLNKLLQEVADTLQPTTNLPIQVHCPMSQLQLESDRDRLREILDHLVQNAIKFTEKGEITLNYEVLGNKVRVNVSDTGKGIAEADQSRIFERFVKVDEFVPGAGLGLSVVKSHIMNLGGTVGVESALGTGSTFWFILPLE